MLSAVLIFTRSAFYGTLLALSLPALLVVLLYGSLDRDTAWAVKWALTGARSVRRGTLLDFLQNHSHEHYRAQSLRSVEQAVCVSRDRGANRSDAEARGLLSDGLNMSRYSDEKFSERFVRFRDKVLTARVLCRAAAPRS
jgi:hypothetical protein